MEIKQNYRQLALGFNGGYQRTGQKYHPIPPSKEFPPDAFYSTEVMYDIKTFTTSDALDIITRSHDWLKNGFYPKFDPDWPQSIYESVISKSAT